MTDVFVKSVVGPDLYCVNLLDEILCRELDSFTIVSGGNQISFNAAIMCSLSPLLSTLVKQIREDNYWTVHEKIFVFLPELRNWKTVKLLQTFLTSGVVDNISQVEIDDLQTLLQMLGFKISCTAHPALTVQAEVEDEDEEFFAEIKYEAEDEEEILEKQDLFTRIQLEQNDYEEIKKLIESESSGWIGNSGNIDQEMIQNKDLEINQGANGNLPTNLDESDGDHNYNSVNYCTQDAPTKFTNTEKNTPTTDIMELVESIPLKPAPSISAVDILESVSLLPNVTNDDVDIVETVPVTSASEDFECEQHSYSYSPCRNKTLSRQPKRKLPNRKTKRSNFEIKENEKKNVKASRKGTTNKAKEYKSRMDMSKNVNQKQLKEQENNYPKERKGEISKKKICNICGTSILAKNMSQHVKLIHTMKDVKNFTCEYCGKSFKLNQDLTRHMAIHTGQKNFTCSFCNKKFFRKSRVKHCENKHNGIFKLSCHLCDYTTNFKTTLNRHVNSHLGIKPYSCPVCKFKSGQKSDLKHHVRTQHKAERSII